MESATVIPHNFCSIYSASDSQITQHTKNYIESSANAISDSANDMWSREWPHFQEIGADVVQL